MKITNIWSLRFLIQVLKQVSEDLKLSSNDESSSTGEESSPLRKKRNLNENDNTFEIHDSFWNCFEEVAADNMRNINDEEEKASDATGIGAGMMMVINDEENMEILWQMRQIFI